MKNEPKISTFREQFFVAEASDVRQIPLLECLARYCALCQEPLSPYPWAYTYGEGVGRLMVTTLYLCDTCHFFHGRWADE